MLYTQNEETLKEDAEMIKETMQHWEDKYKSQFLHLNASIILDKELFEKYTDYESPSRLEE